MVLSQSRPWHAAQQADRVRVTRVAQDRLDRPLLDEAAGVEDADPVAHLPDHAEVVADEEHRRPELLLQARDQVEHLRLDGRVETGRRLVEDQQRRVVRERHRDHRALLHAAGELMRVAAQHRFRVGDLHLAQHLERQLLRLARGRGGAADAKDLGHLLAHPQGRVERPAGILVDHRELARAEPSQLAPREADDVAARHPDRARADTAVRRQVADDGERRRRLAAARLADEPVGLARGDRERDAAEHVPLPPPDAVRDVDVLELEDRLAHRSTTWAIPSAARLTATTSEAIASDGKSTVHQYVPAFRSV